MTKQTSGDGLSAILLIAKSAFAAAPHADTARLADLVQQSHSNVAVRFAFSEQGTPSLREALFALVAGGCVHVTLVPLLLPMEPSFQTWLRTSLRRWRSEDVRPWPDLAITAPVSASAWMGDLLADLIAAPTDLDRTETVKPVSEGAIVPPQKRRVLVCQGGPCNSAGSEALWCHLRNQQQRQKLRTVGEGTMTAKSTCLGPCNLAPVMQVFPEGTYYGGVTEAAIDRIIAEHLLQGRLVEDFAYHPTGRKQRLRAAAKSTIA